MFTARYGLGLCIKHTLFFCKGLKYSLSVSRTIQRGLLRRLVKNELEMIWKGSTVTEFRVFHRHYLEGLRQATENMSGILTSVPTDTEYETVLPTVPLCAIALFCSDTSLTIEQRCSTSTLTIFVTGHDPKPVQSQPSTKLFSCS